MPANRDEASETPILSTGIGPNTYLVGPWAPPKPKTCTSRAGLANIISIGQSIRNYLYLQTVEPRLQSELSQIIQPGRRSPWYNNSRVNIQDRMQVSTCSAPMRLGSPSTATWGKAMGNGKW
jgi:hypothetical protein